MSRILVTGSDGFIGSHLVERLVEIGFDVRAFVYYNSFNTYGWLDTISAEKLSRIEIVTGDIRDPNGVRESVKNCTTVFHLAALIGIPFSYNSPDSYVDTNIKGTLNILNACRELKVEKVIITSTSEVYGSAKYVPMDENHPLQAQSPYAATKIGADQLALSYYRSFGLPVTILRPFNVYGPRQSARAIIPSIMTQIASGKKEIAVGHISPTRDLTYVLDTVLAFIKTLTTDYCTDGEIINIGNNFEISIEYLIKKIQELMHSDVKITQEIERMRPDKSEVIRLWADNSKAKKMLGWNPSVSLEDGLKKTIKWFTDPKNIARYKTNIYNI